jgi:1,2-diacylglycerol 3-beta-glucosyltransferase
LEPISSLTADLVGAEDINTHFYRGLAGRRRKAAVALTVVWSSTIALHLFSGGYWLVLGLTTLLGIHALRVMLARPIPTPEPLAIDDPEKLPFVSLLVAAKNEEAVIGSLVRTLCNLDYPTCRYELWVVDDNSTDRTPTMLQRLAREYKQLRVVRRPAGAGGGKSGALNQVWSLTKGEIVGVFDADAQVPRDLLRRVLPLFEREQVGAVQVRKAISQAEDLENLDRSNLWIQGQIAEMALDAYFQQQRLAIGGIGELRGNGQFVRRIALEQCGGWNEETITDDLDLTIRLHLDHWDVDFLMFPSVQEEGVTRAVGLWHQRNRWAEGGYQRYLDYWRLIARNRMGTRKTLDLLIFWVIQYFMPTAAVPDTLLAIARNSPPVLTPATSLTLTLSVVGMFVGLRRIQAEKREKGRGKREKAGTLLVSYLSTLSHGVFGTLYMLHWIPVIAGTTARISIRPKRLKWVKTIHYGTDEVWLDVSKQP